LIDGRNRMKVCRELEIDLLVEDHVAPDPDPIRLVWSYNAARRQLTKGQKAALASDMANVQKHSNRYTGPKVDSSEKTILKPVTQQEASETFGVDSSMLRKFRMVEEELPEEAERIRRGDASVDGAYKKASKKRKQADSPKVVPITPDVKVEQNDTSTNLPAVSWDDLLAAINFSTELLDVAKQDMMHPQHMVAHRLSESRERIISSMASLSKQERKKALVAVVSVIQYEQEVFQAEAKATMPKYNLALKERLKAELAEQKKITAALRKKVGAGFSKKDFQYIRGTLHTDRVVDEARRDKAFDLLNQLAPIFN
jgi:hypothetical protein